MTTIYEVLRRPLVTEKSNYQIGQTSPIFVRGRIRCDPHDGERCH